MTGQAPTRAIYVTGRAISPQPHAQRGLRMGVPWAPRARSDAYWEQQVSGETRGCDSREARKSAPADTRPTLADHSMTHRNTDAPTCR